MDHDAPPPPPPPPSSSGASSPSSSAPSSPSRRSSLRRTAVDPRAALMGAAAANAPPANSAANAPTAINAGAAAAGGPANTAPSASAAPSGPRVVPRPPLNAYLRIPLIRGERDAVVCPDPGRPGETKRIDVGRMMAAEMKESEEKEKEKEGEKSEVATKADAKMGGGGNDQSATAIKPDVKPNGDPSTDQSAEKQSEKNKKEIPVPTITTVRRYDVDVPPTYAVPSSYVRNVCLHYDEAMDHVEYNVDLEDEKWWRDNAEFGPESEARVVVPGEDDQAGDVKKADGDGDGDAGVAGGKGSAKPEKARGKKGKFVKKASSKKASLDAADDPMDVDGAASDASLPPSVPAAPKRTYTVEQVLLLNPRYLHSRHSTHGLLRKYNPKLPLHLLERMLDLLEKATGFESIMTLAQAEQLLTTKIPELVDIFGPLSDRERRLVAEDEERSLRRWLPKTNNGEGQIDGTGGFVDELDEIDKKFPSLAPPITLPAVIARVYDHWVAKRSKLRKPLLRRYWPPTAATDTNPHQVFRHREKEKRRLRKKRQNDLEAYRKMRRLKADFERVGVLCELIARREEVGRTMVELGNDYFEERWHGLTDAGGVPRRSRRLHKRRVETALAVPKYYDDGPIVKQRGGKKRKRSVVPYPPVPQPHHPAGMSDPESRGPSPVPPPGAPPVPPPPPPPGMRPPPGTAPPPPKVVAGHDGGLPAPHFLQPLATREAPRAAGRGAEDEVPAFPSYANGRPTHLPGGAFRHRPRLGRGGRVVVDRVPVLTSLPGAPGSGRGPHVGTGDVPPPPTVVTYGAPMKRCGYDIAPLGADGPNYSIDASPDKFGPGRSPPKRRDGRQLAVEYGKGTNAASAPKAPPARSLLDLMPEGLGNPTVLSRKIEEICARGLVEDCRSAAAASATGASAPPVASTAGGGSPSSPGVPAGAELDEVLVPIEDWMEAPARDRIYGTERFVIGPL